MEQDRKDKAPGPAADRAVASPAAAVAEWAAAGPVQGPRETVSVRFAVKKHRTRQGFPVIRWPVRNVESRWFGNDDRIAHSEKYFIRHAPCVLAG